MSLTEPSKHPPTVHLVSRTNWSRLPQKPSIQSSEGWKSETEVFEGLFSSDLFLSWQTATLLPSCCVSDLLTLPFHRSMWLLLSGLGTVAFPHTIHLCKVCFFNAFSSYFLTFWGPRGQDFNTCLFREKKNFFTNTSLLTEIPKNSI